MIKNVKNNRVNYFKKLGINIGNDYDEYMNNDECIRLIPSQEMINEIKEYRISLKKEIETAVNNIYIDYVQGKKSFERNSVFSETNYDDLFNQNGHLYYLI